MYIYGGDNEIKPVEHEKGLNFNLYSIDDLIQVKAKIQELKKQIKLPPEQDKHRQKKIYAQIVRVLSENIEYDHWGAGVSREKYERLTGKSYDEYIRENENRDEDITHLEDRNLVGLIRGTAVCQGNAEIIRNIAAEYGIEVKCIRGKNHENAGHEWNQVNLDGTWYDDDFTYYQTALATGSFDKCDAFLMGMEGNIPYTEYAGYKAYTQTEPVGKPYSRSDKKFLLNYGRTQQQIKQQSIQQPEKEKPQEESIKDEVGDEFKPKTEQQQQEERQVESMWQNRFQSWDRDTAVLPDGAKKKTEAVQVMQDLQRQQDKEKQNQEQLDNQNNDQR